jgi:hypothetical protein
VPATTSRPSAPANLRPTARPRFRSIPAQGWLDRLATVLPLLLAAAVVSGCSAKVTIGDAASDTVDPVRIQDAITRRLQGTPDARLGSVVCPKGVKLTEGATFECTADFEGAKLPIAVTLSHVNTDSGSFDYEFKFTKALINTDKAVKEIGSNLPVELANATVDCGTPRLRVLKVGGTFDCTISRGGKPLTVRVTVENVNGQVNFELVPQRPDRPEVAIGRVGDKLTIYDEFGDAQLEVAVTRIKFSPGDELERPQRGLYMGAFVKGHALADEQDIYNLYARVSGHLYETAITGTSGFDPPLEPAPLNKGERASGWLVFDVPTRHGQLVLRDLDEQTIGIWKY